MIIFWTLLPQDGDRVKLTYSNLNSDHDFEVHNQILPYQFLLSMVINDFNHKLYFVSDNFQENNVAAAVN
jgi:hypothetical protein